MEDITLDREVGGSHYLDMPIQPWEIIDLLKLGFYEGCALKYLLRRKGDFNQGTEDLKKAIHCIEHLIVVRERGNVRGD